MILVPPMSMPMVSGSQRLTRARRLARVAARVGRSDTVFSWLTSPGSPARQVRGTDETGPVAEASPADLEHRPVAAAGELGLERRPDRGEQQVARLAHAATDDHHRRVEHR